MLIEYKISCIIPFPFQAAALALTQHLVFEAFCPLNGAEQEPMVTKSDFPAPSAPEMGVPKPSRHHRAKPVEQPPSPLVTQMMEMGFPRKHVEFAIKAISEWTLSHLIDNK